jgi:hypothetical protein
MSNEGCETKLTAIQSSLKLLSKVVRKKFKLKKLLTYLVASHKSVAVT